MGLWLGVRRAHGILPPGCMKFLGDVWPQLVSVPGWPGLAWPHIADGFPARFEAFLSSRYLTPRLPSFPPPLHWRRDRLRRPRESFARPEPSKKRWPARLVCSRGRRRVALSEIAVPRQCLVFLAAMVESLECPSTLPSATSFCDSSKRTPASGSSLKSIPDLVSLGHRYRVSRS